MKLILCLQADTSSVSNISHKVVSFLPLPALQAGFNDILLLELYLTRFNNTSESTPADLDMSALTYPNLRELRMTSNTTQGLVLEEASYPQLRKLVLYSSWQISTLVELHLQLPHLLTLHLSGVLVENAATLAACVSSASCPRLRNFSASDVAFMDPQSSLMEMDMPWMERFELREIYVSFLRIRAPRLMSLRLIDCRELKNVTLLPDGRPPLVRAPVDASDVSMTMPANTAHERVFKKWAGLPRKAPFRECLPCRNLRIDVCVRNSGIWQRSPMFADLCRDLRMRDVIIL